MATSTPNPSNRWPVTVLGAVMGVGLLDQQVITPLIASLAAGLDVSIPEVGWAISTYAVAASLAALFVGPLSDATGRRRWVLPAAALLALSSAAIALWPSYEVFLLARVAAGMAGGTISVVAVAWLADLVPYARRGRAMALVMGGAMGTAVLGQVAAAFAAARSGHETAYAGLAAFALVALLLLAGLRRGKATPGQAGGVGWRRKLEDYLEFARTPAHRAAALGAFCMSGSLVGVTAYASGWMQEARGFTVEEIGLLYGGFGAAIMVVQPLSGPLADRFGKKRFAVVASILVVGITLALPALPDVLLIVAVFLFGCLTVARIAAFAALRSELVAPARRAAFLAFSNTCSQLGIAAAVAIGGMLYPAGFWHVCLAMAGFGALAALLIARVPEPGERPVA